MRYAVIRHWFVSHGWIAIVVALVLLAVILLSWALMLVESRAESDEVISMLQARLIAALIANRPVPIKVPRPAFHVGVEWSWPIAKEDFDHLTSPIGIRPDPLVEGVGGDNMKDHNGLDIATVWMARVKPIAGGIVKIHWPPKGRQVPNRPTGVTYEGDPKRGAWIEILHDNGWKSRYLHLSWTNPDVVHEGWRVETDDVIGRVGSTGLTTGNHLHLELINPSGLRVNPLLHISLPQNGG